MITGSLTAKVTTEHLLSLKREAFASRVKFAMANSGPNSVLFNFGGRGGCKDQKNISDLKG